MAVRDSSKAPRSSTSRARCARLPRVPAFPRSPDASSPGAASSSVMLALESTSTATRDGNTISCSAVRSKSRYAAAIAASAPNRSVASTTPTPKGTSAASRRYIHSTSKPTAANPTTKSGICHHCEKLLISTLEIRCCTLWVAANRAVDSRVGTIMWKKG